MYRARVIPCLLLRGLGLVKTRKFKDPVYVGDPVNAVRIFSEKEVDDVITGLKSKGVKITKEPQTMFWGGYSSYFADPDGYLWEVAYNPFFPFDENGNLKLD